MVETKKLPLASFKKLLYRATRALSAPPPSASLTVKEFAMAGPKAHQEKSDIPASPEVTALRHRRLYIHIRVPNLRQEMKDLAEEKKLLAEELKNIVGPPSEEQKKLRQRRIYVVQRHEALKAELATLAEERATVTEKLKSLNAS
jgi:predicted  nucleic acid-binding Zn-ribbon protein